MSEQQAPADEQAFVHTLNLIEHGFRMGRPDARDVAERVRDQYLTRVAAIAKQMRLQPGSVPEDTALYYTGRATRVMELIEIYNNRGLYTEDRGGALPEQLAKPARRDPIVVLVEKGHLQYEHQVAARDIAECYELACREGMARVRDMRLFVPPPKRNGRNQSDRIPPALAERRNLLYLPWTQEMHASSCQNLVFVLDIVADGRSLSTARQDHRMGYERALLTLKCGLDLWGEMEERFGLRRR